jgi:hypothetical protein
MPFLVTQQVVELFQPLWPVMVLVRVFASLMVNTNPDIEPVPVAVQVKVAAAVTQA